jgi:hypothetical protein
MRKLLSILALGIVGASFANAATYALCIGINQYPEHKKDDGTVISNNLKGCVNDANSMKDLLTTKFAVPADNVHTLLDKAADEDGFTTEVKWLLSSAKPGDQIVFCYSGHGSSSKDEAEANGKESYIVLADEKFVPGKLFGEIAKAMASKGVSSTYIFDSCFAGGMSRSSDVNGIQMRVKYLDPDAVKSKGGKAFQRQELGDLSNVSITATPKSDDATGQYTFLFACKDDQTSSDVSMGDLPSHGLFTLLFGLVMDQDAKTPVKSLIDSINAVRDDLNKKLKDKHPDFEGFNQIPNFESSNEDRAAKPTIIG